MTKEMILKMLREEKKSYIVNITIKHKQHLSRVKKALNWWKKHCYKQADGFVSGQLKIDGVNAMCLRVDLRGASYFNVEFDFRPMQSSGDLGKGQGNLRTIKF